MAARINNVPAYVVYDKTYTASITASFTGFNSTSGTENNLIDKDLTTYMEGVFLGGAGNPTMDIIFDFQKSLWNVLMYLDYDLNNGDTRYVAHSTDGVSWTTLDNSSSNRVSTAFTAMTLRYLRFYSTRLNAPLSCKVYELKLMGSD